MPVRVPAGSMKGPLVLFKDKALTLGRDPRNELVVSDPEVSKRHAEIRFRKASNAICNRSKSRWSATETAEPLFINSSRGDAINTCVFESWIMEI